jgi:hypothetical protein
MERADLLDMMMRDLLDAVERFYGPEGLGKVVEQMKRCNRAREYRKEIDALESMLSETR